MAPAIWGLELVRSSFSSRLNICCCRSLTLEICSPRASKPAAESMLSKTCLSRCCSWLSLPWVSLMSATAWVAQVHSAWQGEAGMQHAAMMTSYWALGMSYPSFVSLTTPQ